MASNPLGQLPSLTTHPSSNSSSSLSSIIEEPKAFIALRDEANERLQTYNPVNQQDNTVVFLQTFLDFLSKHGRMALMGDIASLSDEKLRVLRFHLVDAILKPMRTIGGKTPAAKTPHPGEWIDDEVKSMMSEMEAPTRTDQKSLKTQCLRRDGDRCQISKFFDETSLFDKPEIAALAETLSSSDTATECCHILPFYLGSFDEGNSGAAEKTTIIWNTLYRYFPELRDVLSSKTINSPENAVTMATRLHSLFGRFSFTLKKSSAEENKYKIVHWISPRNDAVRFYFPNAMTIEFLCNDYSIPMPSPTLLNVHERISRILNVSGVAKELDTLTHLSQFDYHVAPDGSTDVAAAIRRRLLILA